MVLGAKKRVRVWFHHAVRVIDDPAGSTYPAGAMCRITVTGCKCQ